jgi:hypothetical protein
MDKYLTSLREDGPLPPSAPPKTPEMSPEKPKDMKAPTKRKVCEDDKEQQTEPATKVKTRRATVRTLMQPMLATTLYLCTPCSNETRAGKPNDLPHGKTSIPVVMCAYCADFNGELRIAHIEEIIRYKKRNAPSA